MNSTPSSTRPFSPARLLVDLNFAAKVWFGLFFFMAFCEAATLIVLLRPKGMGERSVIFVTSNGRGWGGDVVQLAAVTNLHVRSAEDATLAFFNRNPADFDQPERITLLFLPEAARQARIDCDEQSADRRARQLHLKAVTTRLQYIEASNERIHFSVQGYLVETGAFNGQPLVNAMSFKMDLELVPNPNLVLQAAFPLVVQRYLYETHPR